MIPIVVTVSRKGEYTVVAIKQMGILKEERVAGGVGCHRRLGCGGGCRKGWEGERGGAEAVVRRNLETWHRIWSWGRMVAGTVAGGGGGGSDRSLDGGWGLWWVQKVTVSLWSIHQQVHTESPSQSRSRKPWSWSKIRRSKEAKSPEGCSGRIVEW